MTSNILIMISITSLSRIRNEEYSSECRFDDDKIAVEQGNIDNLKEVDDLLKSGQINLAGIRNNNIIYQNQIEQNKVTVNDIYIDNLNSGTLSSMSISNKTSLETVAWQPAILGGEGVYRARAMLKMRLEDGAASLRQSASLPNNLETINNLKVYPNPAKEIIYIESLDLSNIILVQISDLEGRNIYLSNNKSNKLVVDTKGWTNGIYIANVSTENGDINNIKIAVIK